MRLDWRPRGLHAKFSVLVGATLLLMLVVVVLMLQRQGAVQRQVSGHSREAMHELVFERLREHGKALSAQVADSLVNPLYYFDLDAIGDITRGVLSQPDVGYVLVYDNKGNILHDGSGDIPTYGQAMRDPLAYEAVSAESVHAQWSDSVLDIAAPIRLGDQRLGGVRIGYSLDSVRADESRATEALETRLAARDLLEQLLAVEQRFGRERATADGRWGPRTLDLDLLLYGDHVLDEPGLRVPHPHLHERAFALVPLAEIAPGAAIPGHGTVRTALAALDAGGIEAIP